MALVLGALTFVSGSSLGLLGGMVEDLVVVVASGLEGLSCLALSIANSLRAD